MFYFIREFLNANFTVAVQSTGTIFYYLWHSSACSVIVVYVLFTANGSYGHSWPQFFAFCCVLSIMNSYVLNSRPRNEGVLLTMEGRLPFFMPKKEQQLRQCYLSSMRRATVLLQLSFNLNFFTHKNRFHVQLLPTSGSWKARSTF